MFVAIVSFGRFGKFARRVASSRMPLALRAPGGPCRMGASGEAMRTKEDLLNDLKDAESRHLFQAEHIKTGIPIQIRELRRKREWSQKELAEKTDMDQSNISNLENLDYRYLPQIGTLLRLAEAFDVPLIVRFGSWEELIDWEVNLSSDKLVPDSFTEKEVMPK